MRNAIDTNSGATTVPPLAPVLTRAFIAAVAMANRLSALLIGRHRPESEKSLGSLSAPPSLPHFRPYNSELARAIPDAPAPIAAPRRSMSQRGAAGRDEPRRPRKRGRPGG